jgi:adenylate kinase
MERRWHIPHIASGDLLRAHVRDNTELGQRARPYMERGDLVPDALILDMMAERLSEPDAQGGYVLDGFPRTVPQAEALDERLEEIGQRLDAVIYLRVAEGEILRRLSGRRICPKCNAIYQVDTMPSTTEGICDRCGTALVQRKDEEADVVRRRLVVYARETEPLLAHYRRGELLREIDGTIGVDNVLARVSDVLAAVRAGAGEQGQ